MMDKLTNMAAFLAVIDRGSFTEAGQYLGISRAAVSKYVMQLEESLGVRLLNRTTRTHSLTDIGAEYVPRCRSILADMADADACANEAGRAVRGRLRLNAPVSFGVREMGKVIAKFCKIHPLIEIELELNDHFVDVVADAFDVVLRIGVLQDSSLIARKIANVPMVTCAAPSYLEAMGEPQTPQDLKQHACLVYDNIRRPSLWQFENKDSVQEVRVRGPLTSNNGDVLADAARAGLGIVQNPLFIVADDLRSGKLQEILTPWKQPDITLSAVYPSRKFLSARARAFIDHASQMFGA